MSGRARRGLIVVLAVVAVGLLWGGWSAWEIRRDRKAMADVREDVRAGRHATAAWKLVAMLAREPDWDEAAYLLGTCSKARGREKAAAQAWARVRPDSPFAPRAIQGLVELEVEGGRFAGAEELVQRAMKDPRIDGSGLPLYLGPIYTLQGRIEDAERSVEARWAHLNEQGEGASEKAINLVRLHRELRRNSLPVETIRSALDQAGQSAPEDDRVWLGKANLALRTGAHDEARRWLDACLEHRPDDIAVWRARLEWAMATNRVDAALEAAKHLPVDEATPAQVPKLAAWLANRREDRASEQRALERLIAADPTDLAAMDRLAELGQPARASDRQRRKTEIDRLQARYEKLFRRNQPIRDAAELAGLAERLGHWFEARAFATVAAAADPDRDEPRRQLDGLTQRRRTGDATGRTLADVLDAEFRPITGSVPSAGSPPAPAETLLAPAPRAASATD